MLGNLESVVIDVKKALCREFGYDQDAVYLLEVGSVNGVCYRLVFSSCKFCVSSESSVEVHKDVIFDMRDYSSEWFDLEILPMLRGIGSFSYVVDGPLACTYTGYLEKLKAGELSDG